MKWILMSVYLCLAGFVLCGRCDTDFDDFKDKMLSKACYGSDAACNSHNLTCQDNMYIRIRNASYGIKDDRSCWAGIAACSRDSEKCCSQKESDLFISFNASDMQNLVQTCSNKHHCVLKATRTQYSINRGSLKISSYSVVYYSCLVKTANDAEPAASSPVGAIVGVLIAVVVVAVVVVVAIVWYRRRNRENTVSRADKQTPVISKPTEPYMINGIYVQSSDTNDYAQIDEKYMNRTDRVVSPYESASADEFSKGGNGNQEKTIDYGYSLAKYQPGFITSSNRETVTGRNSLAKSESDEDQYNRITFEPVPVPKDHNYSHVIGSGNLGSQDPDTNYDHFNTNVDQAPQYISNDYDVSNT